jgi:uncharacterized protein (TIGR03382 family)
MMRRSYARKLIVSGLALLFAACTSDLRSSPELGTLRAPVLTSRFSMAIRGGAASDSWGDVSTETTFANGQLKIQVPAGATVRQAFLVSSVVFFSANVNNVPQGPPGNPRGVILGGGAALTRQLEGPPDAIGALNTFGAFVTDVTATVKPLIEVAAGKAPGGVIDIPIRERGDNQANVLQGFLIAGHGLVVIWEHPGAPLRNVVVQLGSSTAGQSGTVALPNAVANRCPVGNVRAQQFPVSMGVAWECSMFEEDSSITINGNLLSSTVGGADDDASVAVGVNRCGINHQGLITGGSFGGNDQFGAIGLKGDVIRGATVGARLDDELYDGQSFIADGATSFTYAIGGNGNESLSHIVVQTDAKVSANDTDGDGVVDTTEGDCTNDSDGDGIPDYQDLDSDNDCLLDSNAGEAGGARVNPALPAGAHCSGATPVCVSTGGVGVCTACTNDFGGAAPACSEVDKPICITGGANAGACVAKAANGEPTLNGQSCVGGSASTCASGACESTDMRCGRLNGSACADASVCRSALCHTDGLCGLPLGGACGAQSNACRSGLACLAGVCDTDTDNDGLTDTTEGALGTDPTKADTDGDGVSDAMEVGPDLKKPLDTDGDGKIDALDTDDDGDGIVTAKEIADAKAANLSDDVDGDGKKNWLDTDADGDGVLDRDEPGDANSNAIADYLERRAVVVDAGVVNDASVDASAPPAPAPAPDDGEGDVAGGGFACAAHDAGGASSWPMLLIGFALLRRRRLN